MEDPTMDTRRINRIINYGKKTICRVAIDDFGTGYVKGNPDNRKCIQ